MRVFYVRYFVYLILYYILFYIFCIGKIVIVVWYDEYGYVWVLNNDVKNCCGYGKVNNVRNYKIKKFFNLFFLYLIEFKN